MWSELFKAVLAAAAYFAAARAGYALGIAGGVVTLWPPSGVMLGLLLISGRRSWPAIIAGGVAGSMASDLRQQYTLTLAAFAAFANLSETLIAALVVQRIAPPPLSLDSVRGVVALTLGGAVVSNAVTALIGMWVLIVGFHTDVARAFFIWWVGDGLGMLVVAPIVIAAAHVRDAPLRGQRAELAVLMTLFITACVIGLSPVTVAGLAPAPYVTLPFLFWIAIRLGTLSTATATVIMAGIATWFASARTGPFAGIGITATSVALQVYAYVAAAAVSSLFTAAAVTERRLAAEALRNSEARYREVVQDQTEFIVRWLPDGRRTFVNDAYARYFGAPREALIGTPFFGLISDEHARVALKERLKRLQPAQPLLTTVHLATRGDGQPRWQEWTDRAIFDEHGAVVELQSVGRDVDERIKAEHALTSSEAELRRSITELRALSTRLNDVREEERARIARDVHDHLGQTLTVLKMDVAEVRRRARAGSIDAVEERLGEMSALIDGAVDDVRRVASELRPLLLDEFDLVDAIRFYLDEISHRTGLRCELVAPAAVTVPAEHASALFRILQEALTNVTRHAAASQVRVTLQAGDHDTELTVVDDGRGLPEGTERRPGALGLIGMRDRARLFGGDVFVTGGPGQGTTVTARIPVQVRP